ncbi:hypothetical protein NW805_05695 [Synechococcus sp. W60.1]
MACIWSGQCRLRCGQGCDRDQTWGAGLWGKIPLAVSGKTLCGPKAVAWEWCIEVKP